MITALAAPPYAHAQLGHGRPSAGSGDGPPREMDQAANRTRAHHMGSGRTERDTGAVHASLGIRSIARGSHVILRRTNYAQVFAAGNAVAWSRHCFCYHW